MYMTKPFSGKLRRTKRPAVWLHYRHSLHYSYISTHLHRLQVYTLFITMTCLWLSYIKILRFLEGLKCFDSLLINTFFVLKVDNQLMDAVFPTVFYPVNENASSQPCLSVCALLHFSVGCVTTIK